LKILHGNYMAFICFVWISEQTVTYALYNISRLIFIIGVDSVYCVVRTESLYNTDSLILKGLFVKYTSTNTY